MVREIDVNDDGDGPQSGSWNEMDDGEKSTSSESERGIAIGTGFELVNEKEAGYQEAGVYGEEDDTYAEEGERVHIHVPERSLVLGLSAVSEESPVHSHSSIFSFGYFLSLFYMVSRVLRVRSFICSEQRLDCGIYVASTESLSFTLSLSFLFPLYIYTLHQFESAIITLPNLTTAFQRRILNLRTLSPNYPSNQLPSHPDCQEQQRRRLFASKPQHRYRCNQSAYNGRI